MMPPMLRISILMECGIKSWYAEIFPLQEGVAYKNFGLNPNTGYVGIGTSAALFNRLTILEKN